MRIEVFGKTWTLTRKTPVKVTCFIKIWNDPTVNTHISPQTISYKTIVKVKLLTKVSKSIFPKVWDSFPRQYSTMWRNSWGKFDKKLIWTRLKRSQGSRKITIFKKSWIHIIFLDFWSSAAGRQPFNICICICMFIFGHTHEQLLWMG